MHKRTFFSFSEASNFARQHAQEAGVTLRLEKQGSSWVVSANQSPIASVEVQNSSRERPSWSKQRLEEQQRELEKHEKERAVQKQTRGDLERKLRFESNEEQKRYSYLEDRERHYRSLSDADLENLWDKHEEMHLKPDEITRLRGVVMDVRRHYYLNERDKYYRSLSKTDLENLWDKREEMDLEPDEISRLRGIVRAVKGI